MTSKATEPFARSIRLSAKAVGDIAAKFAAWVKLGDLPAGAVLARFVGTDDGTKGAYVNELTGKRMGDEINGMETLCHLTIAGKDQLARFYLIVAPTATN